MRWIVLPIIVFAAAWALVAAALDRRTPDADFRFTSSGSITTLDPAAMSWLQDLRTAGLLYEGLYAPHPRTMQPEPACAASVDIADGGRSYTFRLRPTARWSDGRRVTASDFVYAWRRAIEPGTAADYAFFLEAIDGMKEYVEWRWWEVGRLSQMRPGERAAAVRRHFAEADRWFAGRVALRALGDDLLWMRLERPLAYWLDVLSFAVTYPLHRETVERFRREADTGLVFYDEQWAKPDRTHYNGPYVLREWGFKRGLRLERNPHYWDAERIRIASVAYIDVADAQTAWLMYESGELDWVPSLEASFAPELALMAQRRARRDIRVVPAFGTYFCNFNCRAVLQDGSPNPFADARVRRAFAWAVDREALVRHVTRRGEQPASTFVPAGVVPGYRKVAGPGYNVARARRELAAAGYPEGRGFPRVQLLYTTDADHGLIAESLAQMWRAALGVETQLTGKEVQSFREDKKNQRFMVCRASWYGDYLDPTTFLDTLRADNGNNDSSYADAFYDELLDAAAAEADPAWRLERLAEAEEYVLTDTMPVLPLYHFVHVAALNDRRVRGFHMNARQTLSLRNVVVAP